MTYKCIFTGGNQENEAAEPQLKRMEDGQPCNGIFTGRHTERLRTANHTNHANRIAAQRQSAKDGPVE